MNAVQVVKEGAALSRVRQQLLQPHIGADIAFVSYLHTVFMKDLEE